MSTKPHFNEAPRLSPEIKNDRKGTLSIGDRAEDPSKSLT